MNKDNYLSAMSKIKASDEFKQRVISSVKPHPFENNLIKYKKLILAFTLFTVMVSAAIAFLPSLLNRQSKVPGSDEFQILEKVSGEEACYISVVYLDGYAYSPIEWLSYSRYPAKDSQGIIKGEKLGEVTLDLKGLRYTGTPPDFSSTYDVGTDIFEIINMKKERAILVDIGGSDTIFYRERKAVSDVNEPINLTVSEVFQMVTDTPEVKAVELRSEEDGSWMRTSIEQQLITMINQELPGQALLNYGEIGNIDYSYRVPVNLIFEDGAALPMQIYPEEKYASFFGGYIKISEELAVKIADLLKAGEEYGAIIDLLPYKEAEVAYLYFTNYVDGSEVLCKEPKWSVMALFELLKYYKVEKLQQDSKGTLVMSAVIGKSQEDSIKIEFYEGESKNIMIGLNGDRYGTVKGEFIYEHLENYLKNYTE